MENAVSSPQLYVTTHQIHPNSQTTRYVLNYKKLPYKTITLEYPSIAPTLSSLGIPPLTIKRDGTPLYTCPSIIDYGPDNSSEGSPKAMITDSYKIAEYLDKAYPSTPCVFPPGTEALQAAFYKHIADLIGPPWPTGHLYPLLLPKITENVLNPISAEYYAYHRRDFADPLSELYPKGKEALAAQWKKVEESFNTIDTWLSKNTKPGDFVMGDTVTFCDFVIAGILDAIRVAFGEESEEWERVMGWSGGRWKRFMGNLKEYASVDH
ncbi:hypothetical protein D9756_009289 [Leucocoprinus leucothites]|uniref:GST N-terminal domain-containing protein n=1 Tax=Leucocoprinus leucothites TaxID=201217 RepID=A0A8H5FUT6_9AGAR|nr:hypothetical protein D9756_009289 [Leucoagaricus leucothites]